ncbi:hypothetical protein Pmani_020637 [Petrolisthes manimaculis]|uniref:CCHC-type domain-containing protein n=1 Tax=Petrolisthes manimaculis TaxID=1843537 RepID=A0AAE1PI41_9EUCA|nr:hypothetical protein Pmani_020637 [Petrolisthes manimaculis]
MEKKAAASPGDCLTMDLRLISEFDGTSQEVVEWLGKLELVCKLRGITELHTVVPLRLTGGAFAVYQQLSSPDKEKYAKIKAALISAFAADKFVAYEQFVNRRLREGESVDVYLADLRRLAELFGGMTDLGLSCAFVAGLPESARRILRAGSRLENMDISQLLNRTQAVLVDEHLGDGASTQLSYVGQHTAAPATSSVVRCLTCNQPNQYARNWLAGRGGRRGGRGGVRCFTCGRLGHVSTTCSGNAVGEMESAPASAPAPAKWQKERLGVSDIWGRVSMDTCYVGNQLYLTLIDCGPTRYAIWKRLRRQDSSSIIVRRTVRACVF